MEEDNQSGELENSGGHGNTQEEYAMRRRRSSQVTRTAVIQRFVTSEVLKMSCTTVTDYE